MVDSSSRGFRIEPLGNQDRAAFSCGKPPLDRYLREQASQDQRRRAASTYVLIEEATRRVGAFYSLAMHSAATNALPDEVRRRLAPYPVQPVVLLGRLALDQGYQGRGLGARLMTSVWLRTRAAAESIAAMALVVDAIDEEAAAFYRKWGFLPFPDQPNRLTMPMTTILDALERLGV